LSAEEYADNGLSEILTPVTIRCRQKTKEKEKIIQKCVSLRQKQQAEGETDFCNSSNIEQN